MTEFKETELDERAIKMAKVLSADAVEKAGSNKTDLKGAATFAPAECATKQWPNCNEFGRQLHFGVRSPMSIEALRKKKRMRRPRPRLTDGQKSAVLLALTFCEGWLVGFAGTHSRIPSPVGTPQWMITGSLALAVILPLVFVGILLKWGADGTAK